MSSSGYKSLDILHDGIVVKANSIQMIGVGQTIYAENYTQICIIFLCQFPPPLSTPNAAIGVHLYFGLCWSRCKSVDEFK